MKVYTTIKILKKVWAKLKEIGLEGLLDGKTTDINITSLIDKLLDGGKLNELCQTITQSDVDFEEMEIADIAEVLQSFFGSITKSLKGVMPTMASQSDAEPKTHTTS